MYLLKIVFNQFAKFDSDSFEKVFDSEAACQEMISQFPKHIIKSWSIHPLYVQAPICSFEQPKSIKLTVSVYYGDNKPWKITHNISPDSFHDLIMKDFDFTDVRFIKITPWRG